MNLENWSIAKVRPLQVLGCSFAASWFHSLRRVCPALFLHSCMGKMGVKSLLRQVPARPNFAAGSYLHAKLAWHLGTVCRVTRNVCFIEARSLISNALTWNKQSSEMFTQSLAELSRVLRRGVFARNHSNVALSHGVREHPILWHRLILASACFACVVSGGGSTRDSHGCE